MARLLKKVCRRFVETGLRQTLRHSYRRLVEEYHERRLGIHTLGCVELAEFSVSESECHDYAPTDYPSFAKLMKHVPIRRNEDCFLDYGSGLGRVPIMAARYPFKCVMGVELSADLNAAAERNVERARRKLKCKDVRLFAADARRFPLPHEVTHVHFYNPFSGEVLEAVLARIRQSLTEHPRRLLVLYNHPVHLEELWAAGIETGWLKKRDELALTHRYVIYEASLTHVEADKQGR